MSWLFYRLFGTESIVFHYAEIILSFHSEIAIVPPMLGISQALLNREHFQVYYKGMPTLEGSSIPLRKHGDEVERLPGGWPIWWHDEFGWNQGINPSCQVRVLNILCEIVSEFYSQKLLPQTIKWISSIVKKDVIIMNEESVGNYVDTVGYNFISPFLGDS